MVVREPGVDQASRQNQWQSTPMLMMASRSEEDDSSCSSSDPFGTSQDGRRKRKGDEPVEDVEVKRRKNREAAKRCRDKKQRQTEDLKLKNGDLEKENCNLAKQRDELIRKCRDYQREIDQHKQQGCVVPHFNPPYNLDHLLQPSSPGSPSFSEPALSTSSCTSPAPSISPGPPTRYPPPSSTADTPMMPLQEGLPSGRFRIQSQDLPMGPTSKPSMPASTSRETAQCTSDSGQVHYLRVKTKDGSYKILCLDHENYKKVMQKLENNRATAGNNLQSDPVQSSASASASADHQTPVPPPEQPDLQTRMNEDTANNHSLSNQVEEQETNPNAGQKLDTCEDLISILKAHVKDGDRGIELTPVSEDEVAIKQEPLDEYEQDVFSNNQAGTTGVKQETAGMPDIWISTGQQIRSSLDTLTNQDHLSSHNTRIQDLVQYLAADEHTVTSASAIPRTGQAAMQKQATYSVPKAPAQMATYITSSAPVGALSKTPASPSARHQQSNTVSLSKQATLQQQLGAQQQKGMSSPAQTVTFGPRVNSSKNSSFARLPGKPQAAHTAHMHNTSQGLSRMKVDETIRAEAASTQGGRMQLALQQQQGIATNVSFQQDSTLASTIDSSALINLQLQGSTSSEPLMSVSSSQIAEYLKMSSIETLNIQ